MAARQISERKINLAFSFQELLTATIRLRFNRQSAPNPNVLRAHMREACRLAAQEAESNGYSPEQVRIACHAVIVFLDETIARSQDAALSAGWTSPLAKELFPNASADAFYRNLEDLLSAKDSAQVGDTLEVCYLCLLLGYRGVMGNDANEELSVLLDKIGAKMLHIRGFRSSLVHDWGVPPEPIEPLPADSTLRMGIAAVAVSIAVCLIAFAASKFSLLSTAANIHSLVR